ncbi:tRNA uridine-5-carboxymethylaminomethyl(34) synthesis GTPase MnmE [Nitrosospira sp. NpAV]|uniref:tRNA uridine-5-carboxymethylaminomethyl(34) synthesis GTPase MnmE n=1 Tax=Nitrosospira sp. NpAV TaxID=58133 RepID=UPI0005A22CA4|nr:tRNA uridine-5-carboxymethylaminomethyl(34) synthesis GTPase MnmE [Nitrosospira sp. NpAV]KIO49642.1 tRNA modification GTPase TrmE [Nitrosospira sp. NpAV]
MGSTDIIAANATPPGRGGIGVVRVSGKSLQSLALSVIGLIPQPRHATFSKFIDENGAAIDHGIALYFPSPHSYTGEDVLELQGHGGPAVMNLLLSRCLSAGARLAQPGEFTLRAFLNGKLDLAQAEGVADIIDASTGEAARCAMRSLQGEFSAVIVGLVQALTELRMLVEATLDFPEEETVTLQQANVYARLEAIQSRLEEVLTAAKQGSLLREGVSVVMVGQPNVGKSSLMNQLAGEETAIVTEIPGTTRDAIRQTVEIEGIPFHLVDTAGLRETDDLVEKIGIARTHAAIERSDLALLLIDRRLGVLPEDREIVRSLPAKLPVIRVYNKIDLLDEVPQVGDGEGGASIYLSAKTGAGIDLLRRKLLDMAGWQPHSETEGVFMARQRHVEALTRSGEYLRSALELARQGVQLDLQAEELRVAQLALSSITGEFSADDLLGEIFSRFCIGK